MSARRLLAASGREDGQAMVEFAVVLPLLLILVTGIIQFGLLFNRYITLTDTVRAGAEKLALGRGLGNPCDPAVAQMLRSGSDIGLTSGQVTLSFPGSTDACGTPGPYVYNTSGNSGGTEGQADQATVAASQPFTLSLFGVVPIPLNLSASASDAIK